VSATLAYMLRDPVQADVSGAEVWTDRPPGDAGAPAGPEVRIFLYGVQPNAAWRNNDLPTRSSNGDLVQRPQAALDLQYLLTFYGDERALEPQRLLGSVVRELHARPLLSRDEIRRMVAEEVNTDPSFPLATTDLADQSELVRFTPLSLDIDEMSKLWSVFFQTPYRLSVAYQASVVLVSPDDTTRPSLPVRERHIAVTTIRRPTITRVESAAGILEPVTSGTQIRILGSQLRGEITTVWFGPERVDPPLANVGEREIRVDVPAAVRAGLTGVRVEHRMLLGDPPTERAAGASNIAPLILRPRIRLVAGNYAVAVAGVVADGDLRSGDLTVTIDPAVGKRQRVVAHLNQLDPPVGAAPASYSFADESRDIDGDPDETDTLAIPFAGVLTGTYLVRIQVDGAESPLDRDTDMTSPTFEHYIEPQMDIP
jgi:hypothetical protein